MRLPPLSEESVRPGENRIGAVCAIAGAFLLLAGTWLHPIPPDPNSAAQAFATYANDRLWIARLGDRRGRIWVRMVRRHLTCLVREAS